MTALDLVVLPPRPRYIEKEWLTRKEVSILLESIGCPRSAGTLGNYARAKPIQGPPYSKSGHKIIRYRRSDVLVWAHQQVAAHTHRE